MSAALGESTILTLLGSQDGTKIGPRSPQDGFKTDQKSYRFSRRFFDRFLVVLGPSWRPFGASWGLRVSSWGRLGALLGTQDGPKIDPSSAPKRRPQQLDRLAGARWPQDRPRSPKMAKKDPKMAPRGPQDHPKRPQDAPKPTPKKTKTKKSPNKKTKQDDTGQDKTRQDKTRQDNTTQHNTTQHLTCRD